MFCIIAPEVSLEYQHIEVYEQDPVASICVVLKSDLKRDIDIWVHVEGITATRECHSTNDI